VIYGSSMWPPRARSGWGRQAFPPPWNRAHHGLHSGHDAHAQRPDLMESGALEDLAQLQAHLAWQVLPFFGADLTPAPSNSSVSAAGPSGRHGELHPRLLASSDEQKHRYFTQLSASTSASRNRSSNWGSCTGRRKSTAGGGLAGARQALGAALLRGEFRFCLYYSGDYAARRRLRACGRIRAASMKCSRPGTRNPGATCLRARHFKSSRATRPTPTFTSTWAMLCGSGGSSPPPPTVPGGSAAQPGHPQAT